MGSIEVVDSKITFKYSQFISLSLGKYCNPNPCQNGGLCEEGSSGPICQCRGFTGTHCSVDINECLRQNPCHNGGTCINTLGSFKCQCPPGTLQVCLHYLTLKDAGGGGVDIPAV